MSHSRLVVLFSCNDGTLSCSRPKLWVSDGREADASLWARCRPTRLLPTDTAGSIRQSIVPHTRGVFINNRTARGYSVSARMIQRPRPQNSLYVRFQVPVWASITILAFLDVTPNCLLYDRYKRFGKACMGRSGKVLLALASTINIGFRSRRGSRPYFCLSKTFTCFEMGTPLRREEGSLALYWG